LAAIAKAGLGLAGDYPIAEGKLAAAKLWYLPPSSDELRYASGQYIRISNIFSANLLDLMSLSAEYSNASRPRIKAGAAGHQDKGPPLPVSGTDVEDFYTNSGSYFIL
jgi:hypothetical protein